MSLRQLTGMRAKSIENLLNETEMHESEKVNALVYIDLDELDESERVRKTDKNMTERTYEVEHSIRKEKEIRKMEEKAVGKLVSLCGVVGLAE